MTELNTRWTLQIYDIQNDELPKYRSQKMQCASDGLLTFSIVHHTLDALVITRGQKLTKIISCGILPPPPYHLCVSLVALFSARRTVGHHNRGISSISNRATITLYPTYFPSVSLMHGFRSICLAFYRCFYFYFF